MRERLDLENINKSDYEQRKFSFLPKIVDQRDLFRVAKDNNQDEKMRLLAVGRIKKQSFLLLLAFFGDTVIIKKAAISRLKSAFALNLIARLSRDCYICRAALDRLINLETMLNPI